MQSQRLNLVSPSHYCLIFYDCFDIQIFLSSHLISISYLENKFKRKNAEHLGGKKYILKKKKN